MLQIVIKFEQVIRSKENLKNVNYYAYCGSQMIILGKLSSGRKVSGLLIPVLKGAAQFAPLSNSHKIVDSITMSDKLID